MAEFPIRSVAQFITLSLCEFLVLKISTVVSYVVTFRVRGVVRCCKNST